MIFDPNMTKKKKKKKKQPFMLDEEGGEGVGGEEAKEVEAKEAEPEAGDDKEMDLDDDDGRKKGERRTEIEMLALYILLHHTFNYLLAFSWN